MAAASTNGRGNGGGISSGEPVPSTHESGPGDSEKADPDLDVLSRGATLGRYLVLERLGAGAMGVVYAAYDPELDRKVAIKILRPHGGGDEDRRRARLVREAKAIAKVSHPNVVGIFDVGVHQGQVFLAMEYLAGGTLREWLAATKRSWREIVKMFIEVGKGLAGAHAEGLIHRDFKPDNVLVDKNGVPKVVDFGLVRLSATLNTTLTDSAADTEPASSEMPSSAHLPGGMALTRTGALTGTPAYMAPEQFLGQSIDDQSDQFAFCVALFEALFGERPFAGANLVTLADAVTAGTLISIRKDAAVPSWVRRVVLRGLSVKRGDRWPAMAALIAGLATDPAVILRRRLLIGGIATVAIVSLTGVIQLAVRRHSEVAREIASRFSRANTSLVAARTTTSTARDFRDRAFAAFDGMDWQTGESLWREARALIPSADSRYEEGGRDLEAALTFDRSNQEVRARLAAARREHLFFAEDFRLDNRIALLQERLSNAEGRGLEPPHDWSGALVLRNLPKNVSVRLERYERPSSGGRRTLKPIGTIDPEGATPLPRGSYRLVVSGSDIATTTYPFEIGRGEQKVIEIPFPAKAAVPEEFVYIPAGDYWFGDSDETLRTQFLNSAPLHRRHGDAFLIARYETTYADWISFLKSLPAGQRERYAPRVSTTLRGSLSLRDTGRGWEISFAPMSHLYRAVEGQLVEYKGRANNIAQDWLKFPVAGVSPDDASKYLAWLESAKGIPGPRLCTEAEWERAARGADDRLFPTGDDLAPNDANHDVTYGRVGVAYGPDVVGLHPGSESPFGVHDLVGNVFEFVTSSQAPGQVVMRGGAYHFGAATCRSSNREVVPTSYRDVTAGFRVCASIAKGNTHAASP